MSPAIRATILLALVGCSGKKDSPEHTVGGTVSGLEAVGLVLALAGETLAVDEDGPFQFANTIPLGTDYTVTVSATPEDHDCTVAGGSGTIEGDVDDVSVTCVYTPPQPDLFDVGGTVSGLEGSGLVLQINGADDLPVDQDGSFLFPTGLEDGTAWTVTIATQPTSPTQDCTVDMGSGTIAGADVSTVAVTCVTPTFGIGGTVEGLDGMGLVIDNGGETLAIPADGPFVFPTALAEGDTYTVTVAEHPIGRAQHCHVTDGGGTTPGAEVTDIVVTCVNIGWYDNGDLWNQRVEDDGPTPIGASDTTCDTVDPGPACSDCLNGGEIRAFAVPTASSCTGLTASDDLGFFDWGCDDSTGDVFVVSTGLQAGVRLTDLVDFTAGAFLANQVEVSDGTGTIWTTDPLVWWENPVSIANTGVAAGTAEPFGIYLVSQDSTTAFDVDQDGVAVVVAPGVTLTGNTNSVFRVVDADFPWFEGQLDVAGEWYGLDWERTPCALVQDAAIEGASFANLRIRDTSPGAWIRDTDLFAGTGDGLFLQGAPESLVERLEVSTCDDGADITSSDGLVMTDASFDANTGTGLLFTNTVDATVTTLSVSDNGATGFDGDGLDGLVLTGVEAERNQDWGVYLEDATGAVLSGVDAHDNVTWQGIDLFETTDCRLEDSRATGNGGDGIRIDGSLPSGNVARDVWAAENAQNGIRVTGGSDNLLLSAVSARNGQRGVSLGGERTVASDLVTYANGDDGVIVSGLRDGAVLNVISAFNADSGVRAMSSRGTLWQNHTGVGNAGFGVAFTDSSARPSTNSIVGANNADNGVYYLTIGDEAQAHDIAGLDNGWFGVSLNGGITVDFSGDFLVGLNEGDDLDLDCFAAPAAVGFETATCVMETPSTALVTIGQTAAASFVGAVTTDDAALPDDVDGQVDADAVTDWLALDHRFRVLGPDGAYQSDFTRLECASGATCRVWDLSLAAGDTVLLGQRGLPDGNDVATHPWDPSPAPTSQADCDAAAPGSVWNGNASHCESVYLRWATELLDDGVGNDNGLCESDEDCLFSPNLGGYQGHGALVDAGAFVDGQLTGITLSAYTDNGR